MNILIPHAWLQEHLETDAKPEKIQEYLSLSGPSVEKIIDGPDGPVYDIEVTTNRVDSMSVRGIAREAAVILPEFEVPAKLKKVEAQPIPEPELDLLLPEIINNPKFCNRITCVILKDVSRTATPEWMANRLLSVDISVHDAAIDITNYITHELGHPCHAFDYDKIMALGGVIKVEEAKPGVAFTTLDGEKYETVGGEIVFTNPKGEIIDLPAIKGTANTSVDNDTTNILLWIESLAAEKVRHASMTHAIRTTAAQLNEKNVDPELAPLVLARGVELYRQLCGAQVASPVFDEYPNQRRLAKVKVKLAQINAYLGIELDKHHVSSILEKLGCEVEISSEEILVQPPTFRPDLTIPADIIEEIARIYGYHNLPSVLMTTRIPETKPTDTDFQLEFNLAEFLATLGWQEVYGYSMVSQEIALRSGHPIEAHLAIANPLTEDRIYLRRSLLPSLEEFLDANSQRKNMKAFELAMTYTPQTSDLPLQELKLGLVSTQEYRQVRGQIEALLGKWYIQVIQISPNQNPEPGFYQSATILVGKDRIKLGNIGQLPSGKIGVEISVTKLLTVARKYPEYQPIPKTSPLVEDLTVTVPADTAIGQIMETIRSSSEVVQDVELLDQFKQNMTFRITYHDYQTQLAGDDIKDLRRQLVESLHEHYQTSLVGSID